MDNLSFHITDITANSIRAKASDIEIDIQIKDTSICIRIADNGCGMDPETVSLIRNPFYFSYHSDLVSFDISTRELKEILENMPLSHPKVMLYLKELIANQIVASG